MKSSPLTSNNIKKNIYNTFWAISENILRIGVTFIVSIYVARYLGPTKLGILSYALSYVALFKFIALIGLDRILVCNLIHQNDKKQYILGSAFWMKFIGAIVLLFSVFWIINLSKNDSEVKLLIMIIAGGMLFDPFRVIESFFQSKFKIRFSTFSYSLSFITSSAIKILLVLIKANLIYFAIVIVIEQFLLGIFLIFFYFRNSYTNFFFHFDFETAKGLIVSSWPLILSSMSIMIYMRIDQVMIKEIIGTEDVGIYSVAVKISELWYFIPIAINQALFPSLIESKANSPEKYSKFLQHLFDIMVGISFFISIPVSILSKYIIMFLFGEHFISAAKVLTIHVWSGMFVFLGVSIGNYLLAEGLQIYSFYRTIIGCIINIFLNLILIPISGIIGAAVATLITQAILGYFSLFLLKDNRFVFYLATRSLNIFSLFTRLFLMLHNLLLKRKT